jgi:hypothetical protein
MEYIVVESYKSVKEIIGLVNERIKDGYIPLGGINESSATNESVFLLQSMIKNDENQPEVSSKSNTTCESEKTEKTGCENDKDDIHKYFVASFVVSLISQISNHPELNFSESIDLLRKKFSDDGGMSLNIGFGYFIDLLKAVYLAGKEDGKFGG